ncbi:fimbria/pilus outer membrane usher protein [Variovorax sp. KBW07]|uniref:fimbria/pilus outer membrane usher protein n=1 Tax=Variovorax sp. KBW07 TaxID=2153358 RepID=UPI0021A9D6D9|nr:fimbria/pilus outer membrane usher protein [Variovorax sp. KBW07]
MIMYALSAWPGGAQAGPAVGAAPTQVAQVEFDSSFLAPSSAKGVDLSRFSKGNFVAPGQYIVELTVNENWVGRARTTFKKPDGARDNASAVPCFSKSDVERMGIDLRKLEPSVLEQLVDPKACLPIEQIVPDATASFDFGEQLLNLSVPQAVISRSARGYVSPEFWDQGITAGFVDYNLSLYQQRNRGMDSAQSQGYLGTRWGFNAGPWRFRHNGSFNWGSTGKSRYQSSATYIQRELQGLSAQLTLGDAYTSGELFDSTSFRGVRLATDDRMLPQSLSGFAPTVRGIARSNAKVVIKQGNTTVYETTVAPGAFEINDLYATGYGGDLAVTVTEADGQSSTFLVPYAAVPMSLRPGVNRYAVTVGVVLDSQIVSSKPGFAQATWQHGFSNLLTGYGGINLAGGYGAAMIGGAFNTSFGAIGVDYTQSSTSLQGKPGMNGGSARISYSKDLPQTGSNIVLAAYRYSSEGFMDLNTAMRARDMVDRRLTIDLVPRPRNRAQVTFGQQLGEGNGRLHMTLSSSSYWNRLQPSLSYMVGYANTFRNFNYSLQVSRNLGNNGRSNTTYYASLMIPLGTTNPVTVSTNLMRDSRGPMSVQSTVSGSTGVDNDLSYGVTVNHASGSNSGSGSSNGSGSNNSTGGSANVLYRTSFADLTASAGAGTGYSQGSLGVRGAAVAHPGGVTLAQSVSETFGIVEAPGAGGARLLNASGVKVDGRGYAVVPYLTPYNMNSVELDPKGLSTDVELKSSSQQVAPTAGAVSMLKFQTTVGRTALLLVRQADGAPLPFGASVFDEAGEEIGSVGQGSKLVVRGLQDKGLLTVKWGDEATASCRIAYELPVRDEGKTKTEGYQQVNATCVANTQVASKEKPLPTASGARPGKSN